VAQQWREELVPPDSKYKEYGELMDACIEVLRQATDESAGSGSDNTEGQED
jgi:hypothetical protein